MRLSASNRAFAAFFAEPRRPFRVTASFALAALFASAETAEAYKAKLTWSAVPGATSYNIYVIHASGPLVGELTAPNREYDQIVRTINVPHRDSQGLNQSHKIGNLPLGPTVLFSVTAENPIKESRHSKQRLLSYAQVAAVVDTDGDGLTNAEEDRDLDGILDPDETDSLSPDTDRDGLSDEDEIYERGTDPRSRDSDRDGKDDADDPCNDLDRDGYGTQAVGGSCPLDNCPWTANSAQRDVDADGLGDACDPCTNIGSYQDFYQNHSLVFRRINTDANRGDDIFSIKGDVRLPPHIRFEHLNPIATGARLVVRTLDGDLVLDEILVPGEIGRDQSERGWRGDRRERTWRYTERDPQPWRTVNRATFKNMNGRWDRTVRIDIRGRNGDYFVDYDDAPLTASITLGDQLASINGACAETPYRRSDCRYIRGGKTLLCE